MYSVEWVVSGDGEDPNGAKKKKKGKEKKGEISKKHHLVNAVFCLNGQ